MWFSNRKASEGSTSQGEDAATATSAGGGDSRGSGVERKEIAQLGSEGVTRVHYAKPVPKLQRKLEIGTDDAKDSPSSKMWQVYALAGFMIGRWVWARVKERRARKDDEE